MDPSENGGSEYQLTEHTYAPDIPDTPDSLELEIRIMEIVSSLLGGAELSSTTCLLGHQGILDSVTTVALIAELEHKFGIDVGDEDLTLDNLSNVERIAILLRNKLSEGETKA
ncbi:D-alanine--poly(phosphoribitol) ligase subunit 2 [compost metagenome]